jgi:zinc protease
VDDVRAHRDRVFCAGRATLGVAGPVDEALRRELARSLEVLRSDACRGRQGLPEVAPVDGRRVLIVDKPEAQAVAVSMGLPVEVGRDHPDYPALWLAAAWLGQHRQFVGRLMQGIRAERGLNYGDYAYAEHFVQEGWTRFPRVNDPRRRQHFSIWLRPLAPEHAHFAIRFAVRELERLVEDGLTQDQLDTIRGFASRYVALYLQTPGRRLGTVMDDRAYGIEGGAGYAERLRAAWADLAVEDLNAAVRRHWDPARLRIAVVHPDAEAFAEALASDAPSPITYRSEVSDEVRAEDAHVVGHPLGIDPAAILVTPVDTLVAE